MSNEPPIVLELLGPSLEYEGQQFCATCCTLYLGVVSEDEKTKAKAKEAVENAQKVGKTVVYFPMPEVWHKRIRPAVTTFFSVIFPMEQGFPPMPVCWVHMQGHNNHKKGPQK